MAEGLSLTLLYSESNDPLESVPHPGGLVEIVIVGAGSVGQNLAIQLQRNGQNVAVLEPDPARADALRETADIQVICSSGSSPLALEAAGIQRAHTLLAVTNLDEVNILACGLARQYGVKTRIARIRSGEFVGSSSHVNLWELGVSHVIDPERVVTRVINQLAVIPDAVEVFSYHEGEILISRHVLQEGMPVLEETLAEAAKRQDSVEMRAVAIKRKDVVWIPHGDARPEAGDELVTVFPRESLTGYLRALGLDGHRIRKAVVAGDSLLGIILAASLNEWIDEVVLIDPDPTHARHAAECLDGIDVIAGDPTDQAVLKEIHLAGAELFVGAGEATTGNVMGALCARAQGVDEVMAISHEPGNNPLYRQLGVDQVISPRRAVAQEIMDMLAHGHGAFELHFRDMDLESLELVAEDGCAMLEAPLSELWGPLHGDAIIGTIRREGRCFIPTGATRIMVKDEVIVVTHPNRADRLRSMFEGR